MKQVPKPGAIALVCQDAWGGKSTFSANKARAEFLRLYGGGGVAFKRSNMDDTATKMAAMHVLRLFGYGRFKERTPMTFPELEIEYAHLKPECVRLDGDRFIQFTEPADAARSLHAAIKAINEDASMSTDDELWIMGLDVPAPEWVSHLAAGRSIRSTLIGAASSACSPTVTATKNARKDCRGRTARRPTGSTTGCRPTWRMRASTW